MICELLSNSHSTYFFEVVCVGGLFLSFVLFGCHLVVMQELIFVVLTRANIGDHNDVSNVVRFAFFIFFRLGQFSLSLFEFGFFWLPTGCQARVDLCNSDYS